MNTEKKNLKVFGYGLSVILGLFAFKLLKEPDGIMAAGWLVVGAVVFVCLALFRYDLLKPLYRKWMMVAHLIGNVVTAVILCVVFYFVFGMAGIVLRLLRKDLLDRAIEPKRDSYWTKKEAPAFNKVNYTKQF